MDVLPHKTPSFDLFIRPTNLPSFRKANTLPPISLPLESSRSVPKLPDSPISPNSPLLRSSSLLPPLLALTPTSSPTSPLLRHASTPSLGPIRRVTNAIKLNDIVKNKNSQGKLKLGTFEYGKVVYAFDHILKEAEQYDIRLSHHLLNFQYSDSLQERTDAWAALKPLFQTFLDSLRDLIPSENIIIVLVPPHDPITSIEQSRLAALIKDHIRNNEGFIDGLHLVKRFTALGQEKCHDLRMERLTMQLHGDIIEGRHVVVVNDVVVSAASLMAVHELCERAGAKQIYPFAFGRAM